MALNGCIGGVGVTAALALLLLPAHYYVPTRSPHSARLPAEPRRLSRAAAPEVASTWLLLDFPLLDVCLTGLLLLLAAFTYLCNWIQRKLMERRILKLNQYLCDSLERLREWDARQEQLEATMRMAQNATSEYNLLLYLLLRQHRLIPTACKPPPTWIIK